jgi:hypothetical protein
MAAGVEVRGKLLAVGIERLALELDGDDRGNPARLGERASEKIDRRAVAGVRHPVPVHADAVHPDDIGLILDGARAQQLPPGVRPRRGPVGDVEQQLVVELGPPAAEHGESQVIADQRTDAQPPPRDAPGRAPGREVLVLAS